MGDVFPAEIADALPDCGMEACEVSLEQYDAFSRGRGMAPAPTAEMGRSSGAFAIRTTYLMISFAMVWSCMFVVPS